jgi:hypothetical protein
MRYDRNRYKKKEREIIYSIKFRSILIIIISTSDDKKQHTMLSVHNQTNYDIINEIISV